LFVLRNIVRARELDEIVASIRQARTPEEESAALVRLWLWQGKRHCRCETQLRLLKTGLPVSYEQVPLRSGPVEVRMRVRERGSSRDFFRYKCRFVVRRPANLYWLYRNPPPTETPW